MLLICQNKRFHPYRQILLGKHEKDNTNFHCRKYTQKDIEVVLPFPNMDKQTLSDILNTFLLEFGFKNVPKDKE